MGGAGELASRPRGAAVAIVAALVGSGWVARGSAEAAPVSVVVACMYQVHQCWFVRMDVKCRAAGASLWFVFGLGSSDCGQMTVWSHAVSMRKCYTAECPRRSLSSCSSFVRLQQWGKCGLHHGV